MDAGVRFSTRTPAYFERFRRDGSEQVWEQVQPGNVSAWPMVSGAIWSSGLPMRSCRCGRVSSLSVLEHLAIGSRPPRSRRPSVVTGCSLPLLDRAPKVELFRKDAPPWTRHPAHPSSCRSSREVAVLATIAFFVALGFGILIPSLPIFASTFGVNAFQAGLRISAFALVRFVTSPLAGIILVNRWGERIVLSSGLLIVALSSLGWVAGFSQSYGQLLVLRGAGGLGSSMFTVSAMALLLRGRPPSSEVASSAFHGGFLFGGVAGPAVGGLVVAWSIRAPFFVYAVTLLVATAVSLIFLSRVRLHEREEVTPEATPISARNFGQRSRTPPIKRPSAATSSPASSSSAFAPRSSRSLWSKGCSEAPPYRVLDSSSPQESKRSSFSLLDEWRTTAAAAPPSCTALSRVPAGWPSSPSPTLPPTLSARPGSQASPSF